MFFTDALKKLYLTKWAGFDLTKMTAATAVFEGTAAEVKLQQKTIYSIAAKHGVRRAPSSSFLSRY